MSNTPLTDALKVVLADSYALYLKTQNFHWNVTGPNFKSLHDLFEEQYTDLAAAIDEIAERIRTLGEKAPGSFSSFSKTTSIKDGDEEANADTMVRQLRDDQHTISAALNRALHIAEQQDDEVTVDMMIERLSVHEKNGWMLSAILGEEVNQAANPKAA